MVTYYHTEDEDGNSNYYYTYNMLDDDWNVVTTDEDYADTNPYMQKFKEAGIKIYSKAEIDDILTERAEKIKYPDGGRGVTSYFR